MVRYFRYLFAVIIVVQFGVSAGFLFEVEAITAVWPLPYTNTMSFIFLSSIAAAAATSTLWCVVNREDAGLAGIALDYVTIFTPLSVFIFQLAGNRSNDSLITFGVVCIAHTIFGLGILIWSVRVPARDQRPMPMLVRWSFLGFVVALILTGSQMIQKNTHILPWRTSADTTVIYGWMFLGAAAYFAYGVLRPGWFNTGGQLAGFLAYDVILIVPLLQKLPTIEPGIRLTLIIYITVVSYSGLLAIYYLFIHPGTRLWRPAPPAVTSA